MNSLTRRKFLKDVLCGVGLTIVGLRSSPLLAHSLSSDKTNTVTGTLLKQFEEARIFFHKKEYAQAEHLYKEILATFPAHISMYDCYKKVLANQSRTTEIIPYYKKAIEKFPDRVDFYDRLAKTYREIATGNKKLAKSLCIQEDISDLLQMAIEWYEKAIQRKPDKKFLYFGLLDTLCAKSPKQELSSLKSRTATNETELPAMSDEEYQLTEPYLPEWFKRKYPNAGQLKTRIVSGVESNIQTQILKIKNKVRRPLYTTVELESRAREIKLVIKKLNTQLYNILYSKNDLSAMTTLAIEILRENPSETQLLGKTRKKLKKAGRWDLQCQLYNERIKSFKDFWTQCGLANAYLHNGSISDAQSLFLTLFRSIKYRTGKRTYFAFNGLYDCSIAYGNIVDGKNWLLRGMEATNGLGGASISLLLKYAQCLSTEGKSSIATELLRKRFDPSYLISISDPILKYIAPDMSSSPKLYYLHQAYNENLDISINKEEKVSILCAIAKIQEKEADKNGLKNTLEQINGLIPSYPFIKKHQI